MNLRRFVNSPVWPSQSLKVNKSCFGSELHFPKYNVDFSSRSIKLAAKKGDTDSAKILAKEVVNARKSVAKIYTAKANLGSIEMQIKQQVMSIHFQFNFECVGLKSDYSF